jgi:uncharacterized membrane protein YozB (DUF420 family)
VNVYDLPPVNATLNGLSAVFLLLGLFFIKKQQPKAHIACMLAALAASVAFLACYLVYHAHAKSIKFTHPGPARIVYLAILATHSLLAVVNLPMIIVTVTAAARKNFLKHRKWARWTFPIWLYVSVTGVIVYFMLYRWFPSDELKEREAARAQQTAPP